MVSKESKEMCLDGCAQVCAQYICAPVCAVCIKSWRCGVPRVCFVPRNL